MKALFKTSMIVSVLMFNGCRYISNDSNPKGTVHYKILDGKGFHSSDFVIFYANETPDNEYMKLVYSKLDSLLESILMGDNNPIYQKIRSGYRSDITQFAPQVRRDIEGLKKTLCGASKFENVGLFIFSNELAQKGKYEYCIKGYGNDAVQSGEFPTVLSAQQKKDFRFSQSPLAMPANLSLAGEIIRNELLSREIVPTDRNFVWISKSHGGSDMLMTPKLIHRVDTMSAQELSDHYKRVAASRMFSQIKISELVAGTIKMGNLKVGDLKLGDLKYGDLKVGDLSILDFNLVVGKFEDLKIGNLMIGKQLFAELKMGDLKVGDLKVGDLKLGDLKVGDLKLGDLKVGDLKVGDLKVGDLKMGELKTGELAAGDDSSPTVRPGITKDVFVKTISTFAIPFSIVFLESCDSDLSSGLIEELKVDSKSGTGFKIDNLYASDKKGLKFETVPYEQLGSSNTTSFSEALNTQLQVKLGNN